MSDAPELPPRPLPSRGLAVAVPAWLRWVGLTRLAASAVSVLVVVGGAVWLLRAPGPATEATIPLSRGSAPAVTLPPPSTTAPMTTPASTRPRLLVVHVAGAVAKPGVYQLEPSARVTDAVDAAGGTVADADLDGLNLAAPLGDGQRVYVPRRGEVDPAGLPSAAPTGPDGPVVTAWSGPVNLNTATAAELETLPGIGPATAAAIVEDRARNGPFASVGDLERVPGIGPSKLAALGAAVTV